MPSAIDIEGWQNAVSEAYERLDEIDREVIANNNTVFDQHISSIEEEEDQETDFLDHYVNDTEEDLSVQDPRIDSGPQPPAPEFPFPFKKRPSISRSLARSQQEDESSKNTATPHELHVGLEEKEEEDDDDDEMEVTALEEQIEIIDGVKAKNSAVSNNSVQLELRETIRAQAEDIAQVKFQIAQEEQVEEELKRSNTKASSLHRSKSFLSRAASTVKKAFSPTEVPTIGISELEAARIEKDTLKGTPHTDSLKFFQTDKWFISSTETSGTPNVTSAEAGTGRSTAAAAKTAGYSILQNEVNRNPFFKEDQITAAAIATAVEGGGKGDSATSKLHKSIKEWDKFDLDRETPRRMPLLKSPNSVAQQKPTILTYKYMFIVTVLTVALIACCTILVPLCLFYYKGNAQTTMNYFSRLSPYARTSAIHELIDKYGIAESSNRQATGKKPKTSNSKSIAYNSFANINPNYKSNRQIKSIMQNEKLRNVFHGVNYAPRNVISPICGATMDDVLLDIATLSKITTKIRLYGLQCDQAIHTLNAISELGVNMTVSLGVWISDNDLENEKQFELLKEVLSAYPAKLIDSILVGNEVLARFDKTPEELNRYVYQAKDAIHRRLNHTIPVGTSEFSTRFETMGNSDFTGVNLYPFLSGLSVKQATEYVHRSIIKLNEAYKQEIIISEIGWPSSGGYFQNATASQSNMQFFIDEFVCRFNKEKYEYYWFEAFDEPWKKIYDDAQDESKRWESHWGLFDEKRRLKVVLPHCI